MLTDTTHKPEILIQFDPTITKATLLLNGATDAETERLRLLSKKMLSVIAEEVQRGGE